MRGFADKDPMDMATVRKRVLLVLNLYDKVDNAKVRIRQGPAADGSHGPWADIHVIPLSLNLN